MSRPPAGLWFWFAIVAAATVACGWVEARSAGAYTLPSASGCLVRPVDTSTAVTSKVGSVSNLNTSVTIAATTDGGTAQVAVWNANGADDTGALATLKVNGADVGQVDTNDVAAVDQGTSGAFWQYFTAAPPAAGDVFGAASFQVPAGGPVVLSFSDGNTGDAGDAVNYAVTVVPAQSSVRAISGQQLLADSCAAALGSAAQAHTDSAAVLAELQAVDADLRSSSAAAVTGSQVVQLSPADRQLLADSANGAHDDLWWLGGVVVGLAAFLVLGWALWGRS